ncbi:uncharacterized protein ACN2A1_013863 isoform 1-T5 [Glossina fuscipes fuscipes]
MISTQYLEKFSESIEFTSSMSPLRNHLQQQQQLQLYNAQTIKAAASHHNKLLPFSIAISYSAKYNNHNELAGRTRVNKNLSSQNNMRRSPMLHPPATTATTNQYLHQSQKQRQYEYLTPSRHPHQQQHHHHRHNVRNQQQSPSTTQPAGNSTTGLNLSTDVMVTTTAQCSKSYFHPHRIRTQTKFQQIYYQTATQQ